ncbi:hypothetical protein AMTRI_Chr12g239670 [Amborella trichopoda]
MAKTGEEVKSNVEQHPAGGVLHQRGRLPFSKTGYMGMALAGFLVLGAIGYFTLYTKAKPDASPSEVAKVTAGATDADKTRHS